MRRQLISFVFAAAVLAGGLVAPHQSAAAADAFSLFAEFRKDARLATMPFVQRNVGAGGEVLEETRGTIWYRAPNFFRLQYEAGDKPLFVSDGANIFIYEEDLQQVIVRKFDGNDDLGLLQVLAGGLDVLRRRYVFSGSAAAAGGGETVWLAGAARGADDPIPQVRLGFARDGGLRRLEMTDTFGEKLLLDVTDFSRGGADGELFTFTPPDGVAVVDSEN